MREAGRPCLDLEMIVIGNLSIHIHRICAISIFSSVKERVVAMELKKMYFITTIIGLIILLCTIGLIDQFEKNLLDSNLKFFKEQALLKAQSAGSINLLDITPFKWDVVYSFTPYTPKEIVIEVLGSKFDSIKETTSEGMNQIVFLKSGKVVCYLYGYPSNNGFGISFATTDYTDGAAMFYPKDNLNFKVAKSEGVIYLEHIK